MSFNTHIMNLTFIRHTSVAVAPAICYGQSDVNLSPTFEAEARQVVSKLQQTPFDAVYCSPLSRCRKLAAYCGYPDPVIDNRLLELNFGDWEMKAWPDIQDPQLQLWYDDWLHVTPTHGEAFTAMVLRVEEFLTDLKKQPFQEVVIFTHAGVIRSAGIIAGTFSAAEAFDFKIGYGETFKITL